MAQHVVKASDLHGCMWARLVARVRALGPWLLTWNASRLGTVTQRALARRHASGIRVSAWPRQFAHGGLRSRSVAARVANGGKWATH